MTLINILKLTNYLKHYITNGSSKICNGIASKHICIILQNTQPHFFITKSCEIKGNEYVKDVSNSKLIAYIISAGIKSKFTTLFWQNIKRDVLHTFQVQ
jgi:hypothetical protein